MPCQALHIHTIHAIHIIHAIHAILTTHARPTTTHAQHSTAGDRSYGPTLHPEDVNPPPLPPDSAPTCSKTHESRTPRRCACRPDSSGVVEMHAANAQRYQPPSNSSSGRRGTALASPSRSRPRADLLLVRAKSAFPRPDGRPWGAAADRHPGYITCTRRMSGHHEPASASASASDERSHRSIPGHSGPQIPHAPRENHPRPTCPHRSAITPGLSGIQPWTLTNPLPKTGGATESAHRPMRLRSGVSRLGKINFQLSIQELQRLENKHPRLPDRQGPARSAAAVRERESGVSTCPPLKAPRPAHSVARGRGIWPATRSRRSSRQSAPAGSQISRFPVAVALKCTDSPRSRAQKPVSGRGARPAARQVARPTRRGREITRRAA
ncbi:unnamed protein product [Diplocarpon coronariae]